MRNGIRARDGNLISASASGNARSSARGGISSLIITRLPSESQPRRSAISGDEGSTRRRASSLRALLRLQPNGSTASSGSELVCGSSFLIVLPTRIRLQMAVPASQQRPSAISRRPVRRPADATRSQLSRATHSARQRRSHPIKSQSSQIPNPKCDWESRVRSAS